MMRHGDRCSSIPGVPRPENKRRFLNVFDNLLQVSAPVLSRVFEMLTYLARRPVLEHHRHFLSGKVPIGGAGWSVFPRLIFILMTAAAFQTGGTHTVRAAQDVHGMRVALIANKGVVALRVAIDAPRVEQYLGSS